MGEQSVAIRIGRHTPAGQSRGDGFTIRDARFPLIWAIVCVVALTVIIAVSARGPASTPVPVVNMAPGSMCLIAHC